MQYRIICTTQVPIYQPTTHAHIVEVGTGTSPDTYTRRWTLDEVIRAIDAGDSFYTYGERSRRSAWVQKVLCPVCRPARWIIRSAPDAVTDMSR